MAIQEFLISEDLSIIMAMEQLDQVAEKVLFVAEEGRLKASVTDGDIRRWILKKGNLTESVKNVANYSPRFLQQDRRMEANRIMKELHIEAIPIVNESMEIVSIALWNERMIREQEKLALPVVIMAGGLGTRLYPYTKILPKPLIPIGEIPIAEHIINRFREAGCKDYYLVVNHKKNMIKSYFNEIDRDYEVYYVDEDIPLGTGGGLSLLKGKIDSTFILSNCDILIEEDYGKIYAYHKSHGNIITMVCSLKNIRIPYGVVEVNEEGEIETMREKPEFTFLTNTGMYIVEPQVIDELKENESVGFPDIAEKYRQQGQKVGVYPISPNAWLDMGQFDKMEEMRRRLEKQ